MVLWDEIGLCRKTIFQAPKNCFFRTCLDSFQSMQNRYVDRLGDLKHCFPRKLEENWGFAHKQFFQLRKNVFFARATSNAVWLWKGRLQENKKTTLTDPVRWVAVAEKQFFGLYFFFRTALMTLRDARLSKKNCSGSIFFPRYSLKLKEARLCRKKNFAGSKKHVFPRCSYETQRSSPLQKINFSDSKKLSFAH